MTAESLGTGTASTGGTQAGSWPWLNERSKQQMLNLPGYMRCENIAALTYIDVRCKPSRSIQLSAFGPGCPDRHRYSLLPLGAVAGRAQARRPTKCLECPSKPHSARPSSPVYILANSAIARSELDLLLSNSLRLLLLFSCDLVSSVVLIFIQDVGQRAHVCLLAHYLRVLLEFFLTPRFLCDANKIHSFIAIKPDGVQVWPCLLSILLKTTNGVHVWCFESRD